MFYDTKTRNHGLAHDPFKAIVAPRPIGWISSLSSSGVANLAPYSFFNAVSARPDMVMFSSLGWKDSVTNIRDTGKFVCNFVSGELLDAMNRTSAGVNEKVDEFVLADLAIAPCELVKVPRVKAAPAALECRLCEILELVDADKKPTNNIMVIGEVVGVHINDEYIKNGRFDIAGAKPPTRMGYMDYMYFGSVFELDRPE